MKKEQVVNCQFSVWYPIFRIHTIKSVILPLPQNVIDYLLDDGTLVVSGRYAPPPTHTHTHSHTLTLTWSDDEATATVTAPEFPEFTSKVLEAINALGGHVFPKLNWSAPRDANWIALNSSLQCHSLSDIFLLFKIFTNTHTHTQTPVDFITCVILCPQLVLRKWSELIPGGEFRCFVKENKLIAISQRDYTQFYQHILMQDGQICQAIQDFFSQHIQYNFLDEDFVFDIYRDSQGRVWLIDLNPFGEVTDSLLFSWEELTSGGEITQHQESPAFRYTKSEVTVQPSPCLSYRIPRDFVDLSTGEDAYKLIDFLKLRKSQQEESDEEDEDDMPQRHGSSET
uniref:Translation initiation factor eIF2 assembly protein n=1 Tax=Monopterus albus TaxID=43700 RepID=A0A3Q3J7U9_MONAL